MVDDFISFLESKCFFKKKQKVLLAVSGGIDSVVMVDMFAKAEIHFAIAHANFHLRGEESERDESFVSKLAENYKAKVFTKGFETVEYAHANKISVQVAARNLRYSWFDELLRQHDYDRIATAHHLDDQVETFLINMARGTGISGLHGMPICNGMLMRPLMFTWRKEIEAYATEHDLDYLEDSSNLSLKYSRNRIRSKVIPQLEKLNPSFKQTVIELIDKIKSTESIYKEAVEVKRNALAVINGDLTTFEVKEFYSLDPIQAWAYELLAPFGFNAGNIRDIIGLRHASPGKEISSPTHRLVRDRDYLIIVPRVKDALQDSFEISADEIAKGFKGMVNLTFQVLDQAPEKFNEPPGVAYFDVNKLEFPLTLRKWKKGDFFYPLGMSNRKKLSDFFTDLKLSKIDKENVWLLCSGEDIIWIIGYRSDERYKIDNFSKRILKVLFRNPSK